MNLRQHLAVLFARRFRLRTLNEVQCDVLGLAQWCETALFANDVTVYANHERFDRGLRLKAKWLDLEATFDVLCGRSGLGSRTGSPGLLQKVHRSLHLYICLRHLLLISSCFRLLLGCLIVLLLVDIAGLKHRDSPQVRSTGREDFRNLPSLY